MFLGQDKLFFIIRFFTLSEVLYSVYHSRILLLFKINKLTHCIVYLSSCTMTSKRTKVQKDKFFAIYEYISSLKGTSFTSILHEESNKVHNHFFLSQPACIFSACSSENPSVLSFWNRIFTVSKIICRSNRILKFVI